MTHESTVRYIDSMNTAIILKEIDTHLVPDVRQRVVLDGGIIGRVDAVEWWISDEETVCVIKLNIDHEDTDIETLPDNHPRVKNNNE